ncbi:MAG TPA: GtrA family protein [Bryobacteraceae bacterium]|jgi:putative flippase GtrA|nr:GtrA family protein [Bryobacteraceae bacterium]
MRFLRFSLIGLLGAALQLSSLHLMSKRFHLRDLLAAPLAVELALLHNFAWHERFTWSDRSLTSLSQRAVRLWRFHLANGLLSLLGNTVVMYCLVDRLKAPVLPAAAAAIALCALANFLLADRWVFKPAASAA